MLKIFYTVVLFLEMSVGIIFIHKLYPEFRCSKTAIKVLAVVLYVFSVFLYVWNSWMFYISNLFVILYSIWLALFYWIFWKSKYWEVLLLQVFYCINISIFKIPMLTIYGIINDKTLYAINSGSRVFADVIYILFLIALFSIIFYKIKITEEIVKKLLIKNRLLLILIIGVEWLMLSYSMYIGKFGFSKKDLFTNFMSIVSVIMVILYLVLLSAYRQIQNENILKQTVYENFKIQYLELKELYEANGHRIHNIKHELLYIYSCLQKGNVFEASEVVKNYLQEMTEIEKRVWTGFSFFDFLLNYKKTEIDSKKIRFGMDIELHEITISEEDLVVIIGNLLDNAMEAAQKCEKDNKYINLKICNINHMLFFKIYNSSTEMPKLEKGKFITKKNDKNIHGWGLESVKRIVELYDGEISFEYSKDYFQVEILI